MKPYIAYSQVSDGNMSYAWGTSSDVAKNRELFFAKHNVDPEDVIFMHCDHEGKMCHVTTGDRGKGRQPHEDTTQVDAFVTNTPGLVLFLLTADCIPGVFYDPRHQVLALAHLSRKTVRDGLVARVITGCAEQYNSSPGDMQVWLGPGIQKGSYMWKGENPEGENGKWQPYISQKREQYSIDLFGMVTSELENLALKAENIHTSQVDTFSDERYFSHRRSVEKNESEGRFATIAVLR